MAVSGENVLSHEKTAQPVSMLRHSAWILGTEANNPVHLHRYPLHTACTGSADVVM